MLPLVQVLLFPWGTSSTVARLQLKLLCDVLGQSTNNGAASTPIQHMTMLRWPQELSGYLGSATLDYAVRITAVSPSAAASHDSPCLQRKDQGPFHPTQKLLRVRGWCSRGGTDPRTLGLNVE